MNKTHGVMVGVFLATLVSCGEISPCENSIYRVIKSPNSEMKAVIFDRGCGATTDFNTQISILPFKEELGEQSGNVLIISGHPKDNGLKLNWNSETMLHISGLKTQKIYKKASSQNNITVQYIK